MSVEFEKGNPQQPKGHALLYFRSSSDPEEIWATYLVILPITVDVSKYLPPFLMNQMGEMGPKDLSAFAFPPVPEQLPRFAVLDELASIREDDILFGGTINPTDVSSAMISITEAVQQYAEQYARVAGAAIPADVADTSDEEADGLGVNEVLYSLMSDSDKLSELTKLVGRLRFAVEGSDAGLIKESEEDISSLANHLPDNHLIPQLVEAVKKSYAQGPELADLYLQRCYHLTQREYLKLGQVEDDIRILEGGGL